MTRRRLESGQGKLGCILWILAFGAAALVAYKMIPIKVSDAQLVDFMDQQARWSGRSPADKLKKSIIEKGKELGLPLDEKNVRVEKRGDRLTMEVRYTVEVDFLGLYQYPWEFHHEMVRDIFII